MDKSPTFDEPTHLASGYSYLLFNDYRMNPESGVLLQKYQALPLLVSGYRFPGGDSPGWRQIKAFRVSRNFLYRSGNDAGGIVFSGRIMNLLLGILLGLLVFVWSRELFGTAGGIISLAFYAFSPTILANARLCTADLGVTLAFVASAWASWRLFQKLTPGRFAASAFILAALFLVKFSAVLMVPVYLVMLGVRIIRNKPLPVIGFGKNFTIPAGQKGRMLCWLVGTGVASALVIWLCIWGAYNFRYSMINNDPYVRRVQDNYWNLALRKSDPVTKVVRMAKEAHLLPEAYLYGFAYMWHCSTGRVAFMNGETRRNGWWYFFPYCFFVKTPLPLIMLVLFMMVMSAMKWAVRPHSIYMKRKLKLRMYLFTPLFALPGIYLLFAMAGNLNIGLRHILVCYPPLFIFAGSAGKYFRKKIPMILPLFIVFVVTVFAMISFSAFPDYLAYFNGFGGGKDRAYLHLVDSSLDWGQDLPKLKKWLDRNRQNETVYLSYFGTADPDHYGIDAKVLPGFLPRSPKGLFRLNEGIYAISATMLQLTPEPKFADWDVDDERQYRLLSEEMEKFMEARKHPKSFKGFLGKYPSGYWAKTARSWDVYRMCKLARELRGRRPDANIGGSILIYRLNDEALNKIYKEVR